MWSHFFCAIDQSFKQLDQFCCCCSFDVLLSAFPPCDPRLTMINYLTDFCLGIILILLLKTVGLIASHSVWDWNFFICFCIQIQWAVIPRILTQEGFRQDY